jgi:Protein of unknown function (DUF1214)
MTMATLPTWDEQMEALKGVVDKLMPVWRPDGYTEAELQDMNKLALSILACGYLCHVYTDDRRPVFMPLWNYACNQGGPNPDYVYSTIEVDPGGVYQISGYRGTTRFVEITQQEYAFLGMTTLQPRTTPPLRATNDLDQLTLGPDGRFCVVVSAERPAGYDGDWWALDPRTHKLLMRKCSCDWNHEIDARVAVQRLDDLGEDMTAEESARRFADMPEWIEQMILFDMSLVRYYREHHGINVLLKSQWIESAGGLNKQAYYDGIYEINDDEALVVEVPLPTDCAYWQILVADDRFATVDWVNRLSSLNDAQARVDSDGTLRVVVSKQDPGIYNWLDKADWPWGILQMRLYHANDNPLAEVKKVPVADVLKHLPPGTPTVTTAERAEQLAIRREGAQLRRIW